MLKKISLILIVLWIITVPFAAAAENDRRVPTVDDLLTIKSVGGAKISPDGARVVYTISETDFKQDATVTHIWLADAATGQSLQLTRGDKSCSGPDWSPDGKWIAFTSSRAGDKNQLFLISPAGGEAVQLTNAETGVSGFQWSADGKSIAFAATEPVSKASKDRKELLGDYEVVRKEYAHSHLWTLDVAEALKTPHPGRQRTKGKDYTVGSFSWSPDGRKISFSATLNPDLIQGGTADIYVLDLADDSVKKIVAQPGPDAAPQWSPDGKQILFSSFLGRPKYFADNSRLALVSADGGPVRSLTDFFDENAGFVAWKADGIYFSGMQKTTAHLFRLDPASMKITRLTDPDSFIGGGFTFSRDGKRMAFTSGSPTTLTEIYISEVPFKPRALTNMTAQADSFILGTREVISWKSKDGTEIEGVLIKPAGFDPAKKYALLCIIHGGPTGASPSPTPTSCGRVWKIGACPRRWSSIKASATASPSRNPSGPSCSTTSLSSTTTSSATRSRT